MRRILLLITDLRIGGTPTVVRELAMRLRSAEVHVEVACLAPWGPVANELAAAGVTVTALGATGPADLRILPRFIRLLRQRQFDTVFSFLVHANAVAAAARWWMRNTIRFIQSIQTTQPRPAWHWWVQRWAQRSAERIVVPSRSVADAACQRACVPPDKLLIIPNAVDVTRSGGADIPVCPDPFPIGFIGRLDPIKRIPDLLEAMKLLPACVHLHIFGDGPDRGRIEQTIARLDIVPRVALHGTVSGPAAALHQIGLLVLPSEAEGFPMVLIEAMAAGVPIVATDAPGIRDVVRDGQTGRLTPVGRPDLLATAITRAIADPVQRQQWTEAARKIVAAHYTWPAVLPQYHELLNLPLPSVR